jgi:hypothetical protein
VNRSAAQYMMITALGMRLKYLAMLGNGFVILRIGQIVVTFIYHSAALFCAATIDENLPA